MTGTYSTITVADMPHKDAGSIRMVTLNRPDVLNAMNPAMMDDLRAVAEATACAPEVRALVITGAGRGFCAGADLSQPTMSQGERRGAAVGTSMDTVFHPAMRALYELPVPKIAAVNGVAAGGGVGLALMADIVVAARSSTFVLVFGPKLGLVPDLGCTWQLPRLVGRARARGLALLGDKLRAEEAERWGLIWKCVDDTALMGEALALAGRLAEGPTQAFARIGRLMDEAPDNEFSVHLDRERDNQKLLADTDDFAEGVAAFLGKRPAKFKGR